MKRIFVDVYLAFNLGDDLFLDILAAQYPDCEITLNHVGSNYDEFIKNYNNIKRKKYNLINKITQRLKITDSITDYDRVAEDHDVLVFLGGSIFREEEYHKSLYEERLKMVNEFKIRNKPTFILGANFGPYHTKEFVEDYKKLFKLCEDVCFRDTKSYNLFSELPQVRYASDIVFQLDVNEYKMTKKKNIIGFSIIDVKHKKGMERYEDEYLKSTAKAIELAVSRGFECCLLSFCEQEGDLEIAQKIKRNLPLEISKKVSIYNYNGDLKKALRLISTFRLIIAARFHANILALKLQVGLIPIIYSNKTLNMLFDLNEFHMHIEMDNLQLQYDKSFHDKALNKVSDINDAIKSAAIQFEKLNEFIDYKEEVNLS
ncbi:polysaccharide pyruvyl transferase family protein [Jeotgalibacillus sp. S-D1]|uniref:polysaccharide pyruvyl transferase family protein n=1 Tax=Jeotgalibacillus sp. S-D1 TaxID=2552189 RepID=UPI0010596C08|nr:polysaccharide pyruvyl transferase family protein [Jeotgalibacillus sp. S-D1]TDL31813.1 polysaccharide pyruvyl transferase family protein [Jeotgalibacillus sp. S-D1]